MRLWAITALLLSLPASTAAQLRSEVVTTGFVAPLEIVQDPTDPAVYFVVEQSGVVRAVRLGQILARPLIDLRDVVSSGGERGLLGLAFAPLQVVDPESPDPPPPPSRRFFVNFTNRQGDTVIARFTRSEGDPLIADLDSRFDLVWPNGERHIDQPFSNHNGGHIAFGPDGFLYVGMGDGGSGGDPFNHAQNPASLLGKMLRLDVDVGDDHARGYRIPADNPFVDGDPINALHEIWAFGLRNPWKFSFDDPARGGVGALLIADVGQNAREEINFEPQSSGGRNYGWRLREGRRPYDDRRGAAFEPLREPIHEYDRSVGTSVTGGFIYRGAALPDRYRGRYFFADFVDGRVFSIGLHPDEAGEATASDLIEHTEELGGRDALGNVSTFGVDADGELLLANYDTGRILRIIARPPD